MSDNNVWLFDETIDFLKDEEAAWLAYQLDTERLNKGVDYVRNSDLDPESPDYVERVRAVIASSEFSDMVLLPAYVIGGLGFSWVFGEAKNSGKYLRIYSDKGGNLIQVIEFTKAFLREFRPEEYWYIERHQSLPFEDGFSLVYANRPTRWFDARGDHLEDSDQCPLGG